MNSRQARLLLCLLPALQAAGQPTQNSHTPGQPTQRSQAAGQPTQQSTAEKLVRQSMDAMGGDAWQSVKTLRFEGYGNYQDIDESERPEGPFIPAQENSTFTEDIEHKKAAHHISTQDYTFGGTGTYILDGSYIARKGRTQLAPAEQPQTIQDELFLAPENILVTALQSKDLQYLKDTTLQQAPHAILAFHWGPYPVRFFLNRTTSLLTAVMVTKPYKDVFLNIWGDSKRITYYSFWNFIGKGLHYPLQKDSYINGWYQKSYLITKWEVNPPVDADSLSIPDSIKVKVDALAGNTMHGLKTSLDQRAKEIAPGAWLLPGPCNSTVIEQPDGLVAIEAPFSSEYGELLIAKIRQLFPGKKIKALVSTSDAWFHIGGTRAFAALPDITIYHPYRNQFILQKLLQADYHTDPDAFARQDRHSYKLVGIKDSIVVGKGDNQLVLYPYQTETGDRQMMVYWPHRQLVYASDLYQPKSANGQYWNPHIAWEVYHSITARRLTVQQFYGMHTASLLAFSGLESDFRE